jgi:hypothetical protein
MKIISVKRFTLIAIISIISMGANCQSYPIAGTNQTTYYNNTTEIAAPLEEDAFYGQDANYQNNTPNYTDNGDGTVTDNITGLMWSQTADLNGDGEINVDDKLSYTEAIAAADTFSLAGYSDWRLPNIKEQYSLIIFSGLDPSGYEGTSTENLVPFIDDIFGFDYGDQEADERIIDAQFATTTLYVSTTMNGDETVFGVNFADGRIKGYGTGALPGQTVDKQFYVYFVRENTEYGINDFEDNQDGTITDHATGLIWTKNDNGEGLNWEDALSYAENYEFAGYSDWRLPNVKELQSIVDYTRSPATTSSAAINPMFNCSTITDEGDESNYPFYWSSTTHANWTTSPGSAAAYVCFGEALGWMEMPPESGNYNLMDVHGAGAQRSDLKTGNPDDFPYGHGPQGDVIRIYNYVRLVRNVENSIDETSVKSSNDFSMYPNPAKNTITISSQNNQFELQSVKIYDSLGKIVSSSEFIGEKTIDISYLSKGIYTINCISNQTNSIQKLVIE